MEEVALALQPVSLAQGPPLMVGKPRSLFVDRFESPHVGSHTAYDAFPDGRFVMTQSAYAQTAVVPHTDLVFIANWFEELKRLAAAQKQ